MKKVLKYLLALNDYAYGNDPDYAVMLTLAEHRTRTYKLYNIYVDVDNKDDQHFVSEYTELKPESRIIFETDIGDEWTTTAGYLDTQLKKSKKTAINLTLLHKEMLYAVLVSVERKVVQKLTMEELLA